MCSLASRDSWETDYICVDIREQGPRIDVVVVDDDGAVETWEVLLTKLAFVADGCALPDASRVFTSRIS